MNCCEVDDIINRVIIYSLYCNVRIKPDTNKQIFSTLISSVFKAVKIGITSYLNRNTRLTGIDGTFEGWDGGGFGWILSERVLGGVGSNEGRKSDFGLSPGGL